MKLIKFHRWFITRPIRSLFTRFCFILCAACLLLSFSSTAESIKQPRPNLIGTIVNQNGNPLKDATVFIFTAGPRVGTSVLCPSCYPDCRKHAATDSSGKFHIEALDPNLLFRLLVVGKGFKPQFVPKTDPFKGPVKVFLEPLNLSNLGPNQSLKGRVIDPDGNPIFGAVVNFDFFYGLEANCGGQCDGVDLVSVADHNGDFLITSEKKFEWMTITVEAAGYAKRKFFKLSPSKTHDLKLTEGAIVSGRIVHNGKPIPGVNVGLVSVDRSDNFTGNFEIATNEKGEFRFENIPPYQNYFVYGITDSLKKLGCVPIKQVRTASDGTTRNVGDLAIVPGRRLTGRIVLSDGKSIPAHTRLHVGRQDAWDSLSVELDGSGQFELANLPPESYGISLRVPGYTMSTKNKSLDRLNGDSIVGRIDQDTDVTILMEPGKFERPDWSKGIMPGDDPQPREKPLQGAVLGNL